MKYLALMCEQKKGFVLKIYQPFWLCSQLRYKNKMKKKKQNKELLIFSLLTSEKPIAYTLL